MDIGAYLKKYKMTQKELAEKSGISPSAIQHYVSGLRLPTLPAAIKIVEATKGEVSYLDLIRYWDLKNEKRLS
jgi:transcriptional regulator with XRE-family HTH domain